MRVPAIALLLALAAPARAEPLSDDPGRGHYLFAPSAFLLRGGEVVLSQTELIFSSVTAGFGSHVNVLLGSASPALTIAGARSLNIAVGLKAGYSPLPNLLHLAIGFETLTIPNATGGYGFGVATVGRESLNATLGLGIPMLAMGASNDLGPPLLFIAGSVGIGKHLALASENWFFPSRPDLPMVNAGMMRVMFWRLSLGLGGAYFAPMRIPLPWIDLAVRVGG